MTSVAYNDADLGTKSTTKCDHNATIKPFWLSYDWSKLAKDTIDVMKQYNAIKCVTLAHVES